MNMNTRLHEIAAMIRAALDANRKPVEIDASAYAPEVEVINNFAWRIRATGKSLSAGLGQNAFQEIMPDSRFADAWLSVGADAIVVKTTVVGTLPTGERFEWPVCNIFHVANGVISRLDYYTCAQQDQKIMQFVTGAPPDEFLHMEQIYPAPH